MTEKRFLVRETEMVKVVAVYSLLADSRDMAIERVRAGDFASAICRDQDIKTTAYHTRVSPLDEQEERDLAHHMLQKAIN